MELEPPSVVMMDNEAATAMAGSDKDTARARHISRRHHFVRQGVSMKQLILRWTGAKFQLADFLTKSGKLTERLSHPSAPPQKGSTAPCSKSPGRRTSTVILLKSTCSSIQHFYQFTNDSLILKTNVVLRLTFGVGRSALTSSCILMAKSVSDL